MGEDSKGGAPDLKNAPELAGYRIAREIGRGGMGLVYEAVQSRLGRRVAIKELRGFDEKMIQRFRREASILARLGDHENIVQVFDIVEDEGHDRRCIVMEFVEGRTLSAILRTRGGRLEPFEAVSVAVEASRALEHAHAKGVVHRDIKPGNIMVNERGVVKVMDFGIAWAWEEGLDSRLTLTGQTLGTPTYMSPEQAEGERELDGRSDLYSLAVVLYQCVCGQAPFRSRQPLAILRMHLEEPPVPPSELLPGLEPALERAILKGLAKDPDNRFQTPAEMRAALEAALEGKTLRAPSPEPPPPALDAAMSESLWERQGIEGLQSVGDLAERDTQRGESLAPTMTTPGLALAPSEIAGTGAFPVSEPASPTPGRPPSSAALLSRLRQSRKAGGDTTPTPAGGGSAASPGSRSVRLLARLNGPVAGAAFSPDGARLLTAGEDKAVRLWDIAQGTEALRLEGHGMAVRAVAFSPDGKRALSGSLDGTVRLWDLEAKGEERRFEGGEGYVFCVAFSPDGKRALAGRLDGSVQQWDVAFGRELALCEGHSARVAGAVFSPRAAEGLRIFSGGFDGAAILWDAETGLEILRADIGGGGQVACVAVSPDGTLAATGHADGVVRVWGLATGKAEKKLFGHEAWAVSAVFSPCGRRLLTVGRDKRAILWNLYSGEVLKLFEGHDESLACAAMSPDGSLAATAGKDGQVFLWSLDD